MGSEAIAFSAITDAASATGRLYDAFVAELLTETLKTDNEMESAISVENASFTWDSPPPEVSDEWKGKKGKKKGSKVAEEQKERIPKEENIFQIRNVNMSIPRGSLVAVVGPVGSGKSSLLQGLIGEMRRTAGSVTFGGTVGYCPQSAWIQVKVPPSSSNYCPHNFLFRMRQFVITFVLDVRLMRRGTGKPYETLVSNLISIYFPTMT